MSQFKQLKAIRLNVGSTHVLLPPPHLALPAPVLSLGLGVVLSVAGGAVHLRGVLLDVMAQDQKPGSKLKAPLSFSTIKI